MNCYYHPDTTTVATCLDCSKGLCKNCSDRFSIQICPSCNAKRAAGEKRRIFSEFGWMIGISTLGLLTAFYTEAPFRELVKQHPIVGAAFFYYLMGIVAGWNTLNKLTSGYFLLLPIIGWAVYFIIKLLLSSMIGMFIAPFRIYKRTKRLIMVNRLLSDGWPNR